MAFPLRKLPRQRVLLSSKRWRTDGGIQLLSHRRDACWLFIPTPIYHPYACFATRRLFWITPRAADILNPFFANVDSPRASNPSILRFRMAEEPGPQRATIGLLRGTLRFTSIPFRHKVSSMLSS